MRIELALITICILSFSLLADSRVSNVGCDKSLAAGVSYMGFTSVLSDSATVQIYRGETLLLSNDFYIPGESLTVKLSSAKTEYMFEASNAAFDGGECTNQIRKKKAQGTLIMPSSGQVLVWAGWAQSKSAVQITPTFTLNESPPSVSPSVAPSIVPSLSPSHTPSMSPSSSLPTVAPTINPSPLPTVEPSSATPTITYEPTSPTVSPSIQPTISPSVFPSPSPSLTPSCTPTASPSISLSPTDEPTAVPTESPSSLSPTFYTVSLSVLESDNSISVGGKVAIGVIFGAVGILLFSFGLFQYARAVTDKRIDPNAITAILVKTCAVISSALAIVVILLMISWAKDGKDSEVGFLGRPDWDSNVFAYHPVLMTAGFFAGQIFAVCTWSLLPTHYSAKLTHVMWQTAALSSMIAGFVAVVKHYNDYSSPTFTTMHSWVGIIAICLFGVNFLWGSTMAILTACVPSSILRQAIDLRSHHRFIGAAALMLTLAAVLTGIMDQLPQGSCYYTLEENEIYGKNMDSGSHYKGLPIACRIAQGVGICAIIATLLCLWAVACRGDSFSHVSPKKEFNPASPQNLADSNDNKFEVVAQDP